MAGPTTRLKIDVLEAALNNVPSIQICRQYSVTPDLLRAILADHAWPNRKAVQWHVDVLSEDLDNGTDTDTAYASSTSPKNDDGAGAPSASPTPEVESPHSQTSDAAPVETPSPAPSSPPVSSRCRCQVVPAASRLDPCDHHRLLREANKSTHQRTRNLGAKAQALLAELDKVVVDERREKKERADAAAIAAKAKSDAALARARAKAAADAQKAADAARAELASLAKEEARIAAAKAAAQARVDAAFASLRDNPTPALATEAPAGAPAAVVREWAAGAGVDCPAMGRVPNAVREAYDQAHPTAGAA